MPYASERRCTAFEGATRIASGVLADVALKVKKAVDRGERGSILIFDDVTSDQIELDVRGTAADVLGRLRETTGESTPPSAAEEHAPRGPGRPKLGVVAREVTLLPRHWEWLNSQPGGASVALRKLVEESRRGNESKDRVRTAQESAYRFMSAMAGNLPDFEEALRALFAGNRPTFDRLVDSWPPDIRDHARTLAAVAFEVNANA